MRFDLIIADLTLITAIVLGTNKFNQDVNYISLK